MAACGVKYIIGHQVLEEIAMNELCRSELPTQAVARDARPLWERCQLMPRGPGVRAAQRLCDVVAMATSAAFAVPIGELIASSRRSPYVAFARQSAMCATRLRFRTPSNGRHLHGRA